MPSADTGQGELGPISAGKVPVTGDLYPVVAGWLAVGKPGRGSSREQQGRDIQGL